MMPYNPTINRNLSSFPLSIGTGLAFESIFKPRIAPYDPNRIIPDNVDLTKYNTVLVNVFTLYRNLVGSMSSSDLHSTSIENLSEVLQSEIEVIYSLFSQEGNGLIIPTFYNMTYAKVWSGKWSKSAIIKHPKTAIQQDFYNRYKKILKVLSDVDMVTYDSRLPGNTNQRALILTHMPIDLVEHTDFKTLDLLESNTGKVKTPNTWSTKYAKTNGGYINNVPFNKMLLTVFGDRNIIKPYNNKVRNTILDVAKVSKWTGGTTIAKVRLDLKVKLMDPYLLKTILEI